MGSIIKKYKFLYNRLQNQKTDHMFLLIDLDVVTKSRKNMRQNYAKVHDLIYKGKNLDTLPSIIKQLTKQKMQIAELTGKIAESKKKLKQTKVELTKLIQ